MSRENKVKCCLTKLYNVDHSEATEAQKSTLVTIGRLFDGQPVCAYCLARLAWFADTYGYADQRTMRGGTNIAAKFTLEEAIARSPLKAVLEDIDVTELKWQIDHYLFELDAVKPIQPRIDDEIDRINRVETSRNGAVR